MEKQRKKMPPERVADTKREGGRERLSGRVTDREIARERGWDYLLGKDDPGGLGCLFFFF